MSVLEILICGLIVMSTFLFMEFMAWFAHKYIMHGFLWTWHRSHHKKHNHTLERNDLFAVVFSIPCISLFYYATLVNYQPYLIALAIGIFCYGAFYILFHDFIVHQRVKWKIKNKGKYLKRMINAHYIHHTKHTKDDCEAFGFLYAPKKFEVRE